MNELKMSCMKSDASNSPFRRFRQAVLSVADDRVADRGKLHSDLILQSRHQRNSDQRSGPKRALDGVPEFSPGRFGVAVRGQPLKHSFSSKVVNERPFFGGQMPANYCQILSHRSMAEKLSNECVSIRFGFCKEQSPGRETIDAMYDKGSLSLRFQFCGKKRQGRRCIGAFHRHSQKSGRFIQGHDRIVFVEDDKFPGETRQSSILLS